MFLLTFNLSQIFNVEVYVCMCVGVLIFMLMDACVETDINNEFLLLLTFTLIFRESLSLNLDFNHWLQYWPIRETIIHFLDWNAWHERSHTTVSNVTPELVALGCLRKQVEHTSGRKWSSIIPSWPSHHFLIPCSLIEFMPWFSEMMGYKL